MVGRFDHPWPNSTIATESIKNSDVYVKDKECMKVVSMEELMVILGWYFTSLYQENLHAIYCPSLPWQRVLMETTDIKGYPSLKDFSLKTSFSLSLVRGAWNFSLLKRLKRYCLTPLARHKAIKSRIVVFVAQTIRQACGSTPTSPLCYMKGFVQKKSIELFQSFTATRRNLSRSNLELPDDPVRKLPPEGEIIAIAITNTPREGRHLHQHLHQHHLLSTFASLGSTLLLIEGLRLIPYTCGSSWPSSWIHKATQRSHTTVQNSCAREHSS
ncbi:hypothetical protein ZWY2020_027795 [Hordeum vulgare]|nr:hypothetical protein ZWY2020_027795 [Hordeum vulgare]